MQKFLFIVCISFFFLGCEKEDNVRDVVIEVKVDAITSGSVLVAVILTRNMQDISVYEELGAGSIRTFRSNQMTLDEGVTCQYDVMVLGVMDINGPVGLPADIEIKIKSDNKVIWSYNGNKGTGGAYISNGNLIIR